MIELQKAALDTDIFRFKQYICENFQKKRKIGKTAPDTGELVEMELPYASPRPSSRTSKSRPRSRTS